MEVRIGRDSVSNNCISTCCQVNSFAELLCLSKQHKFLSIVNKATFQFFGWIDVDCKHCKRNSKPCARKVILSVKVIRFFSKRNGCIIRGKSCGFHALYELKATETLTQSWTALKRLGLPARLQIDLNCECIAVPGCWEYKSGAKKGLVTLQRLWQLETQYECKPIDI